MALEPVQFSGGLGGLGVGLIPMPIANDARDRFHAEEEIWRREFCFKRRMYYLGGQYDKENADELAKSGSGLTIKHVSGDGSMWPYFWGTVSQRLPEQQRRHAYSSGIREAIDFQADEMASAFYCKLADSKAQQVYLDTIQASDALTGEDEGDEPVLDEVLRDAMQVGDIAVELVWDPVDEVVRWDFWESEHVDFQWNNDKTIRRVVRSQVIWIEDVQRPAGAPEVWKRVVETCVYEIVPHDRGTGELVNECRKQTYINYSEVADTTEWLGTSKLPWQILRMRKHLRAVRGESLITEQIMQSVDRYNANEQLAYLISRYNSHGHLGIVGDQAYVKLNADASVEGAASVEMDVADVLAFPGGTALQAITLPTDPKMIEHQRGELSESIYKSFGLARVDPDTMAAFSSVSGYALEILNRRTEGTFRRLKRFFLRDWRSLVNRTLDCHAEWSTENVDVAGPRFFEVDPSDVYEKRDMELRMDSGYIVDHIVIRDDFAQQLISRAEALRKLGYDEDDIKKIQKEIEDEAALGMPPVPAMPGSQGPPGATTPPPPTQQFGKAPAGNGSQQGTLSGSTVGGTGSVTGSGGA